MGDTGGSNQVTDTSGITEGDGHFLHDHQDIMANPAAKNALAKYDSAEKAMLGGVEAMTLVGRPHINIPGENADQTVKDKFAGQIAEHSGAITKIEDVKITRPEGSDEKNYNMALEKVFCEMVVQQRMNQPQVDANYGLALKMIEAARTKTETDEKAVQDATVTQLTSDLGGEVNYKEASELNTRCLESFFDAETAKMIEEKGIGNHVGFFKGINELAKMAVKEGRTMKGSQQTQTKTGGVLTYKEMEKRAEEQKG